MKKLAAATFGPLIYLFACAVLAAIAAYPLFVLTGGDDAGFFRSLVSRGGQVFLVLGLYPVAKRLGLRAPDLGLRRDFPRQLGIGLALGILMLSLHIVGLLVLEVRAIHAGGFPEAPRLLSILAKALATGAAVALLEETIFRGVLFAALRKLTGPVLAIGTSAFYYAALHFIRARWTPDPAEIGWGTGFRVAADGLAQVATLGADSFLALLLAGILLGTIRARIPQGLGYCMGLHAGWVFVIKSAKPLTHVLPNAEWGFLVSPYDRIIGILSSAWMVLLILGFLLAGRRFAGANSLLAARR